MGRIFALAGIVVALDRLSKWWVVQNLDLGESLPLIPGIFHLTYVRNTGAAFSMFPNATPILAAFSALVVAGIIVFGPRIRAMGLKDELGLILGGGLGNLVDRVREGGVVDFLDFRIWPVFNLADTALVIGVVIAGWHLLRSQEAEAP